MARTDDGILSVNVWPSREGSESAAADERRVAVLGREQAAIQGASKEHHELARCVVAP